MSNPNQQSSTGRLRSAVEIMDEEFKIKGDHFGKIWTQAELDESRRLSDRHEELLAKGYSEERIDALWEGKTPQEIIAGTGGNGTAPQATQEVVMDEIELDAELSQCDRGQLIRLTSLMGWSRKVTENADDDRLIALLHERTQTPEQQQKLSRAIKQVKAEPGKPDFR